MKFSKYTVKEYYETQLQYRIDFIYNIIDKALDKSASIEYYEGMLGILLFLTILEDKITNRLIFGGVQEIWIRNAALVVMTHLLTLYEDDEFATDLDLDLE